MKLRRIISAIVCVAMLMATFTCAAADTEGRAVLPASLKEIRAEAFLNDPAIEKVVVPEGTEKIGSRAFAESGLKEIEIPESVTYIADDAFEGCEGLEASVHRGSYAHEWACFSGCDYSIIGDETEDPAESESVYSVSDVKVMREVDGTGAEQTYLCANVTASDACILKIEVLDEDGSDTIFIFTAEVSGNVEDEMMKISAADSLPEYYRLRAVLADADGNVLSTPCTTIEYTNAFEKYNHQTIADFPEEQVLDFGESGFAVLAEGINRIESGVVDKGNGIYEISAGQDIQPGDILMLMVDGAYTAVKVGGIAVDPENFSMTIEADGDLYLSEVYDVVNVDGPLQQEGQIANGDLTIVDVQQGIQAGVVTGIVHVKVSADVALHYDKVLFGQDYFDIEVVLHSACNGEVKCTGEFDNEKLDYNPLAFQLYNSVVIIPGINAPAFLSVQLPLYIRAEAGATLTFGAKSSNGFTYNPDDGYRKIEVKSPATNDVVPDEDYLQSGAKMEFGVKAGLEVELIGSLLGLIKARIAGMVGGYLSGRLDVLALDYSSIEQDVESKHACEACVDIDAGIFGEVKGALTYKITKKVTGTLLDFKLFEGKFKLADGFLSLKNEPESIYGGEKKGGLGECQNIKYRVNVRTEDMFETEIEGLPVTVTSPAGTAYEGVSPYRTHLYPGTYDASATFESGTYDASFTVLDDPRDAWVTEKESILDVTVKDSDTGEVIAGANATLVYPDGTEESMPTTTDGTVRFSKLRAGAYIVRASAANYEKSADVKITIHPNTNNGVTVNLEKDKFPVITAEGRSGTIQALTSNGTCPDYVPEIWLTCNQNYGQLSSVTVAIEGCEDYTFTSAGGAGMFEFFGVDMGNGEYTYVLCLWNAGTFGGGEIVVFHVKDGAVEALKSYMHNKQRTDNIYVSGKFSSNTKFSGTIYPTKKTFTAVLKKNDGLTRSGESIYENGLGTMYYEQNADGKYDLIFTTTERCYNNMDVVGGSKTRYVMKEGKMVIMEQWYESYAATVTQ